MVRQLLLAVLLICPSLLWACQIGFNLLTIGRPFRIVRVEELHQPRKVLGWDSEGLFLEGQPAHVQLRGQLPLAPDSALLRAATKRGVELSEDGRVFGLMRIRPICGNDPIGLLIVRLDLRRAQEFIDGGGFFCGPEFRIPEVCANYQGMVSDQGWMAGEYREYLRWEKESMPQSPPHEP